MRRAFDIFGCDKAYSKAVNALRQANGVQENPEIDIAFKSFVFNGLCSFFHA